jgi:hypothetical protein
VVDPDFTDKGSVIGTWSTPRPHPVRFMYAQSSGTSPWAFAGLITWSHTGPPNRNALFAITNPRPAAPRWCWSARMEITKSRLCVTAVRLGVDILTFRLQGASRARNGPTK